MGRSVYAKSKWFPRDDALEHYPFADDGSVADVLRAQALISPLVTGAARKRRPARRRRPKAPIAAAAAAEAPSAAPAASPAVAVAVADRETQTRSCCCPGCPGYHECLCQTQSQSQSQSQSRSKSQARAQSTSSMSSRRRQTKTPRLGLAARQQARATLQAGKRPAVAFEAAPRQRQPLQTHILELVDRLCSDAVVTGFIPEAFANDPPPSRFFSLYERTLGPPPRTRAPRSAHFFQNVWSTPQDDSDQAATPVPDSDAGSDILDDSL